MTKNLVSTQNIFKDIFSKIKERNFKGYTGIAIKNSLLQVSTTFVAKIGSFFFTIILARLLMPELFGLYSLALSTILIFMAFSDIGISQAMIRFISGALGKSRKKRAKAYFLYFRKLKAIAILGTVLILIISAKFLAENYYQKPLFLALIAGSLYILFTATVAFLQPLLQASNNFKGIFYKEIVFQILRIVLVPALIIISLRNMFLQESILFFIILGLSLTYLVSAIVLAFISKKKLEYLREKSTSLVVKEKKKINKFVLAISAIVLSGIFFGYIDMVMLGKFVPSEFIGYYQIALSLVGALGALITFSAVFLPLFSRMKEKQLERAFKGAVKITLLLSLMGVIFVLLFAPIIINLLYGPNYSLSINILRGLSLLIISMPLIALFTSYFISKGEPKIITKALIFSIILNIILNYLIIKVLIPYGSLKAVFGVTATTIFSRYFYLGWLFLAKKRKRTSQAL